MIGIYEIVNLCDGKASTYIGSSSDIEQRWGSHCSALCAGRHENEHLQRAWDKYGEDVFVFSILEEVDTDMLLAMEQEYLDDYFDRGHCYNIATIAGPGGPVSEEARRKISEAMMGNQNTLGYKHTDEARRKISEAMQNNQHGLGHKHTEKARCGISAAKMGHDVSEETRRKLSVALRGHKHTEEARHNMSEAKMGHEVSEEVRRRLSAASMGNQNPLGCKRSDETKRKCSEAKMGELNPMWGKHHTEEHKRKISEALKQYWAKQKELNA